MSFKKNIYILFFAFVMLLGNSAFATKLPNDIWNYINANLSKAQQRFDSVIVLSDDVMYIPLYPPNTKEVEKIQIEYTYPENKTLKDLPEVVLFNNGYSLLKVFKDEEKNYTLTKKDDLPIKVRLGLMPQDMLTPVGLKMPESLKLTLGDLLIPSKEETTLALKEEEQKQNIFAPTVKRNEFIPAVEFKNKKIILNARNSKFLSVYDNADKTPLYELKLASMPLKIVTSEKSKTALILYWSGKNLEIINLKDENTIAQIPIDANATDVVLNEKEDLAYVTSQNANSIYVIDLGSALLKKVIKLVQKLSKITYCSIDDTISFVDEYQSKVFNITKNADDYIVQPMGSVQNISKILSDVANIYVLSRLENELHVFDKAHGTLLYTVEIDKKPTDAILWGTKLFILCSREGYLDVYDTLENKIISREKIASEGFYSKITLIPNEKNILITGINAKNYLIYNLETMQITKKQESYVDVANIIFLNKNQGL